METLQESKVTKETDDTIVADPLLVQILSTKRAHESKGDTNFRMWLFNYIAKTLNLAPTIEVAGNILVQTDTKSTVLFSCHVDTVHSKVSSDGSSQSLSIDPVFGHLFLTDKDKSGCLGGDDGCGIYIMLKMLAAGVKGKYIFHTGEEKGGVGSRAFVEKNKTFCEDIEMVVAFDRAVKSQESPEVIITQGGQPCASTEFGEALCAELNKGGFDFPYVVSHRGSFTDSKVYRDRVPECVNIGCFYEHQHTANEYVDVVGLEKLVNAAITVAWDKLPIVRNPLKPNKPGLFDVGDDGYDDYGYENGFSFGGWNQNKGNSTAKSKVSPLQLSKTSAAKPTLNLPKPAAKVEQPELLDELLECNLHDIEDFAENCSDEVPQALILLILRVRALEAELAAARTMLGI